MIESSMGRNSTRPSERTDSSESAARSPVADSTHLAATHRLKIESEAAEPCAQNARNVAKPRLPQGVRTARFEPKFLTWYFNQQSLDRSSQGEIECCAGARRAIRPHLSAVTLDDSLHT